MRSCSAPPLPISASTKSAGKVSRKQKGFPKPYMLCCQVKMRALGGDAPREQTVIFNSTFTSPTLLYSTYRMCFLMSLSTNLGPSSFSFPTALQKCWRLQGPSPRPVNTNSKPAKCLFRLETPFPRIISFGSQAI